MYKVASGRLRGAAQHGEADGARERPPVRSISEISSWFFGPRPWHIEIRHRVKKTSTINSFGFETLQIEILKIEIMQTDRIKTPLPQNKICNHHSRQQIV